MNTSTNKNIILDMIIKSYQVYFDIEKFDKNDNFLAAKCEFHVHNEKYVLVKKAKLWNADANEYVFIFITDSLNKDIFTRCKNYAYEEGMKLINPGPGHMYSYITAIFICDNCDKEAEKLLKKCKIIKNFKFSLHGWMDYRTTCVSVDNNYIFGNRSSRETTKFLKNLINKDITNLIKSKEIYS